MAEDNSKLFEGIAYFEKMLKLMPGDRTTLEVLSVAYEQVGDVPKTRTALIQLAETLLREKDYDAADAIGERLSVYTEDDAKKMVQKVKSIHGPVADPEAESGALSEDVPVAKAILDAVKAEASLVHALSNRGVVGPEMAEVVQRHLAGLPEATRPFLVSALAIIYRESISTGEKVAAYVADTVGTPPVALDAFPLSKELLRILPENLVRVRGVVPFAKLGDILMIAALDPMDEGFRHEIERRVGGPCRFFLAHPANAEEILEKFYAESDKTTM